MITFNGLVLNPNMVWQDCLLTSNVVDVEKRTIGQKLLVFSRVLVSGMPITLVALEDQGWLTVAQVKQLRAWNAIPGVYDLIINSSAFRVRFDNTDGNSAVSFVTLIPRPDPLDSDYCVGSLKFKVV